MEITYTGQHLEVTAAIKEHVEKRIVRLAKHASDIISVHFSFHVENKKQIAKATVHIPGSELFAQHSADDLYKSIDMMMDKLVTQLDKHKK